MGSLRDWILGLVSRLGLYLDIALPVGMDAVSLRCVAILPRLWLGLDPWILADGVLRAAGDQPSTVLQAS